MPNISIGIPMPASLFKFEKHSNLGNLGLKKWLSEWK